MSLSEELKIARDVALRCVTSAHNAALFAASAWYHGGRGPDDDRLNEVAAKYQEMFQTLETLEKKAITVMTPPVQDALMQGEPHEARLGKVPYANHHEAAIGMVHCLTTVPIFAAEVLPTEFFLELGRGEPSEDLILAQAWPAEIKRGYLGEIRQLVLQTPKLKYEEGLVRIRQEYTVAVSRLEGPAQERIALTDAQREVYELIRKEGPLQGPEIVRKLALGSESTLTSRYIPALKTWGIVNRRGLGYFHPETYNPD